jgi:voltage-gated potassium channel Kch
MKNKFLVLDYDPEIIKALEKNKINCLYGDAEDTELLDELCLPKAKMVISTIPDYDINSLITKKVREVSENTIIILVSNSIKDSLKLYGEGASYVIIPRFLGGEYAATLIEKNGFDLTLFLEEKMMHLENLGERTKIK